MTSGTREYHKIASIIDSFDLLDVATESRGLYFSVSASRLRLPRRSGGRGFAESTKKIIFDTHLFLVCTLRHLRQIGGHKRKDSRELHC